MNHNKLAYNADREYLSRGPDYNSRASNQVPLQGNLGFFRKIMTINTRNTIRSVIKTEMLNGIAETGKMPHTIELDQITAQAKNSIRCTKPMEQYIDYKVKQQHNRFKLMKQSTEPRNFKQPIILNANAAGARHNLISLRDINSRDTLHFYLRPDALTDADLKTIRRQLNLQQNSLHTSNRSPILGKGSFGTVRLVQRLGGEQNGRWFAMKETADKAAHLNDELNIYNRMLSSTADRSQIDQHFLLPDSVNYTYKLNIAQTVERRHGMHSITELGNNCDLIDYFRTLSLNDKKQFVTALLEALKRLHQLNIAHLDLKPTNILLDQKNKKPLIIDFGLSSLDTEANKVLGSKIWMAPEVYSQQLPFDSKASDIYSMGLIIATLLGEKELTLNLQLDPITYPAAVTHLREQTVDKFEQYPFASVIHQVAAAMLKTNPQERCAPGLLDQLIDMLQ